LHTSFFPPSFTSPGTPHRNRFAWHLALRDGEVGVDKLQDFAPAELLPGQSGLDYTCEAEISQENGDSKWHIYFAVIETVNRFLPQIAGNCHD
jgi:hypothetical protein